MMPSEFLAQINESRIDRRFASSDMKQPCFAGGIESFRPLTIRAVRCEFSRQGGKGNKAIGAAEIAGR
jgi:hypothetical protein